MRMLLSEIRVVCTSRRLEVDLGSLLIHPVSTVESRAVKHGMDSSSLIPLESFAWAKGSSATSAADPKVDKSTSEKDAGVSNLLKMNFLSSPSTCAELVDQIRQAGDLGTSSTAEGVADQADDEVAADQGSPASVWSR
ncbi:unnamed protein product [Prunus brigantina]